MKKDKNVYFLTGDLGYHVLEQIEADFPERFINCGIAEANMIGVATGLALSGKKVFVYSIIPFLTMRPFEQIRNDICYHNLDVKLLGVGSGMSYGVLGATHFALEDVGVLSNLPNMMIINPADSLEAKNLIEEAYHHTGPVYFRIGKKIEPDVFEDYDSEFGMGIKIARGHDISIFTTGTMLDNVFKAANLLKTKYNICAEIIHFPVLKPIDKKIIISSAKNKKAIFVVDESYTTGSLGSFVSEVLSEIGNMPKLIILGVPQDFVKKVGSQEYLRKHFGLDIDGIVKKIFSKI
jgi:transketolase